MATNNDLKLALRITADVNDAKRALETLTGDIQQTSSAVDTGNMHLSEMVSAQDAAANAARQTSSAVVGYQQAVAHASSSSSTLSSSISEATRDLSAQQTALAALLGRIDPVVGAYERLDNMERQLGEFNAAGLIGGDDFDLYAARLNDMRDQVEAAAYAASEAGQREAQAARESAQAAREAAQVDAQARATKEAFIARLREQAETMNMTTTELLQYKAAQLGVADAADPLIRQTQAAWEAAQAAREAAQVDAQAKASKEAFIARLREQAETMNLSAAELLRYKAAQLGVSAQAESFIQKLTEQKTAMDRGRLSAGQYAQAMRLLPMQMTDIVTSLASGMPFWMVAIQQGGQIADSFGGLGNLVEIIADKFRGVSDESDDAGESLADTAGSAADAADRVGGLSSVLTPARLGLLGLVTAIVAAGVAVVSVMNDQDEFNRAIAQTGNIAGVTAGQLEMMAQRSGELAGSVSQARDILTGLTSSGKFTAATLDSVAQAASVMAELTGQSADQVVSEFVKMEKSVSEWAVNSNHQYHWLDAATYMRIRALEEQGKKEEAIDLAAETYKQAASARLKQLETELNWVARAWDGVKESMGGAIDRVKSGLSSALGLDSESEARVKRIEDLRNRLAFIDSPSYINIFGKGEVERIQRLRDELTVLEQKEAAVNAAAEAESNRLKTQQRAIQASGELGKIWAKNASETEKEAVAIEKTRKQYEALWKTEVGRGTLRDRGVTSEDGINFFGGQWDIDVAALDTTNKKALQYNETLRKTIEQKKALTQLDRVETEIRSGSLKDATRERQEEARALARQADAQDAQIKSARAAAAETKRSAAENQRFVDSLVEQAAKQTQGTAAVRANEIATRNLTAEQRKLAEAAHSALNAREFQDKNLQLQMEYMRASGDNAGASLLAVSNQYQQLRDEFTASGNTEGLNWLDKLLPLQEAQVRVDALKKQFDDLAAYRSQREISIQAQVQGGLISEIEGRRQLVALHQQVGEKITAALPQLREMANLPGAAGENIRTLLASLESELGKLRETGNQLTVAFKDGLQGGIESSLNGLADGTMNLSDAVLNLGMSIVKAMSQIASQQLAQAAMSGLSSLGDSLFGSAAGAAVAAAGGGHVTGPGTGTSDSISAWLSNDEFITRAAVTRQPGALSFLHDFNRYGMSALHDWTRVRHATGGLAGFPAPRAGNPIMSSELPERSAGGNAATPINLQQTLLLDAADVFTKGAQSVAGQRALTTYIRANKSTLKQELGIK